MRTTTKSWRLTAAIAAMALAATACGGDEEEPADEGADTEETDAEGTDTEDSEEMDEDAGAGGMPEFEAGSTMAEIQEAGTLRVGVKYDQPLFGVNTPSGVEGFDAEIAALIAEGIFGPDFDVETNIEWSEAVSAVREEILEQDQVDLVAATYTINDERKERVAFAGPYYVAGQDIMVEEGNPESIMGVDDMNGQPVCSVEGSTSIDNLREMAPDAEVIALDTYSACAEELSQGNVTAVTTDNVILIGLIDERSEFELVDNPFTEEPYGLGVQLEADDFRTFVNDRLEEIYESGEWAEAWESTAGQVTGNTPEPPEVDRY
jgi:glutamate transport system substrate-binding protein